MSLRFFWCLIAMLLGVSFAGAGAAHAAMPIHPLPCIKRVQSEANVAMLFTLPALFDCVSPQKEFGRGDYWVLMRDFEASGTPAEPLVLRTGSVWQDRVTLHIQYADGHIEQRMISSATTSPLLQLGAIIQYPLPPRTAPVRAILMRIDGSANIRGILLAPRIEPAREASGHNVALAALYAGFAGLALALLCYNLAMWNVLRHRFQIAYCAMLVAMIGYAFSSSGALAWMWPAIDNNDRLRINYALLSLAVIAALWFVRHFFERRIIPSWLHQLTIAAGGLTAFATTAFILFAPWQIARLDAFNSIAFILLLGCAVPIGYYAWVRGSRFFWLFTLTWCTPFLLAVIRAASNIGIVAPSFWLDNSTILAMAAEALLSAIAIAYRVRMLSDERDRARADENLARLLADTDPLTGLLNRRAFLASAIGASETCRLMLLDIDGFKTINDRVGHDGGDQVLRTFARTLRAAVPQDALIARMGGEEFALLLDADRTRPEFAALLLDRIRQAAMPGGLTVTASIGIADGPLRNGDDWTHLYHDADRALYQAKADGRDRAHDASGSEAA